MTPWISQPTSVDVLADAAIEADPAPEAPVRSRPETEWGLAAVAHDGPVRLEIDEGLNWEAYAATVVVGHVRVHFTLAGRDTLANVQRFLAQGAAGIGEQTLGPAARLTRDDEFPERYFLHVGRGQVATTITLAGEMSGHFAKAVHDAAGQLE